MSRATYFQTGASRHGDQDASKKAALLPFSVEALSEQTRLYEKEHISRSNTPSMTNGSSRSASSSIVTCYACGHSGTLCNCSDAEKARVLGSEWWTGSRHSSPALLASPGKGFLSPQFQLYPAGSRGPYSRPMSRISTCSTTGPEDAEPDSDMNVATKLDNYHSEPLPPNCSPDKSTSPTAMTERRSLQPQNVIEFPASDSEAEDDEDDSDESDDEDENNDWSGQDTSLEAVVLDVVGEDLPLAAHLIPILYGLLRSELATNATEKLGLWRYGVTEAASRTSTSGEQKSHSYTTESGNSPRKRQRQDGESQDRKASKKPNSFDDGEGDEDEDPQESQSIDEDIGNEGQKALPWLACPFHKRDPGKYGVQYGEIGSAKKTQYRSCGGPGFKSIQRLKEHFKRKHSPAQCDRCYQIFVGSERAACVSNLQTHRQLADPCQRGPDSKKEGISDAQWALLDKKRSSKKSHMTSYVEVWMEYWDILFPGERRPQTPWYDSQVKPSRPPQPEDAQRFVGLFKPILSLKVGQEYIRFLEGEEDEMKARVEQLAYQAFQLYLRLHGTTSITNSSSSSSLQQSSLLGGSFHQISTPRTSRRQHTSSGSRSTIAYSMDVSDSPAQVPMAPRSLSQGQPSRMAPPLSILPHIPTQSFAPNTMPSQMQNEQQRDFRDGMVGGMNTLGSDHFIDNGLGAQMGQWAIEFNDPNSNFYTDHQAPILNPSDFPLSPMMGGSDDNRGTLQGYGQHQFPGNLQYDGTQ